MRNYSVLISTGFIRIKESESENISSVKESVNRKQNQRCMKRKKKNKEINNYRNRQELFFFYNEVSTWTRKCKSVRVTWRQVSHPGIPDKRKMNRNKAEEEKNPISRLKTPQATNPQAVSILLSSGEMSEYQWDVCWMFWFYYLAIGGGGEVVSQAWRQARGTSLETPTCLKCKGWGITGSLRMQKKG